MSAIQSIKASSAGIGARRAGFLADVATVAGRALRQIPREPETMIPSLIVPVFFFAVNVGALERLAERGTGIDFRAFQLPVAIIFAVTGISRAGSLVTDIQTGYFDRLLLTPVRRLALLLGLMVADLALVVGLSIPVLIMGWAVGVDFASGPLGVLAFLLLTGAWAWRSPGSPTRSPSRPATRPPSTPTSCCLPVRLPDHELPPPGGAQRLAGHRLQLEPGHLRARRPPLADLDRLGRGRRRPGLLGVGGVGLVSMSLALATLRGRVRRG
jgi:ABC-2 type transport system permease protein